MNEHASRSKMLDEIIRQVTCINYREDISEAEKNLRILRLLQTRREDEERAFDNDCQRDYAEYIRMNEKR